MKKPDIKRIFWAAACALLLTAAPVGEACGAAQCRLLQIVTNQQEIVTYIESDSKIEAVNAQVAQYPCEKAEIILPGNISVHTVIMLDNSLSVTESNRENIKKILRQYVGGMPENEVVSLALFGEGIEFLAEKSANGDEILSSIENITFQNQDTFLTDFLYKAIEKIEKDPEYTRFLVISDGVDNKAIGITREELAGKLKETSRPVYTVGHKYKENDTELKNMFALSRGTGGKELLIEDFQDMQALVDEIHDFSNIYSVKMNVPENMMDGDSRHILLELQTQGGKAEVTGEAAMPFTLMEEPAPTPEPTKEPAPTLAPTPEPSPAPIPTPAPVPEPASSGIGPEKIGAELLLAIAAAIYVVLQKKKNPKGAKSGKGNQAKPAVPPVPVPEEPKGEEPTVILDGRYLLILRDRENPEKIFRYPLDGHVIIGRNVDKVQIPIDYNLTISGQHCEFYIKNNRFFIRDMNSSNHTYLEGRMVEGEREILSGNTVKLGEVAFSVEIMPI